MDKRRRVLKTELAKHARTHNFTIVEVVQNKHFHVTLALSNGKQHKLHFPYSPRDQSALPHYIRHNVRQMLREHNL